MTLPGRVDAISKLIESIPRPTPKKKPEPKAAKPKPIPPVFQVHSAKGLDIGGALETLKGLYGDAKITGDRKAQQITAFVQPAQQEAIKKTLMQMTANVTGDNEPRLEIYSVLEQDLDSLQGVLAQATPGIQISTDAQDNRLLIVGDAEQHQSVRNTLEKLDAIVGEQRLRQYGRGLRSEARTRGPSGRVAQAIGAAVQCRDARGPNRGPRPSWQISRSPGVPFNNWRQPKRVSKSQPCDSDR